MRLFLLLSISAALSFAQLQGIVDIHVHTDPDSLPRSIDALDLAKLAKDAGMRALVLKNHWAPTVQLAYTVNRVVPGIEIYGAISLDRAVGGVNPEAVKQAAAFAGKKLRIVWMPTFDSENNVRFDHKNIPFVSVARKGSLLPYCLSRWLDTCSRLHHGTSPIAIHHLSEFVRSRGAGWLGGG